MRKLVVFGMLVFFMAFVSSSCYDESYGCASSKVCVSWPVCEGIKNNADTCFGRWYIPIEGKADKFYIRFGYPNFPERGSDSGMSDPGMIEVPKGKYYIDTSKNKIPFYTITAFDYCSGSWTYISSGWLFEGNLDVNVGVCKNWDERCVGKNFELCVAGRWVPQRPRDGKCGVVFPKCGDGKINDGETCESCPQDVGVCPSESWWARFIEWFKSLFGTASITKISESPGYSSGGGSA